MMVVAYHLLETYFHGAPDQPINHGYLAVDFFFVLSGFVVGYAYDDRWHQMSTWSFFKRRLIRLHPMVVLGTLIGTLFFYFGSCEAFPMIGETPWYRLLLVMLIALTIIPVPRGLDIRGWGETNPLVGPVWSLQLEYLANILYAFFFRRLSRKALACWVVLFACLTLTLCLNIDVTGFLKERDFAAYTVVGGWSLTPDQIQIGLTRLLYPFFCGLLLSRTGKHISVKNGFGWCALLIVVLLSMPYVSIGGHKVYNGIYEAACILLLFPLIVAMGAGSQVTGRTSALNKLLGELSYPLYLVHYPLVYMQMAWADNNKHLPVSAHVAVSVSVFVLAVLLAYASYRVYDLPVRAWLRRKLFDA